MYKPGRRFGQLLFLLVLLPTPNSARPAHVTEPPPRTVPVQARVPVDISSTYYGRVYYSDVNGDRRLMEGPATLVIGSDGKFTLTSKDGRQQPLSGTIKTWQFSDTKLTVGVVAFDMDSPFEIKWYREGDTLKLVRAKSPTNAKRVFRFCTDSLNCAQCKGDISMGSASHPRCPRPSKKSAPTRNAPGR